MRSNYKIYMGFLVTVGVMSLTVGCGKVTQVTSQRTDAPAFDLSYTVPLVPTRQVTAGRVTLRTATANVFSLYDVPVHAAIYGISSEGGFSELSWGRAELRAQSAVSGTGNVAAYRTLNFRKDGVEIDRSDYKWATLSLSNRSDAWTVQAAKVKHGYPLYLLSVYSQRGALSLRVLPQSVVSGNVQVSLPALSAYDTFVAVMYLTALAEKPQQPLRVVPADIQRVFTPEFFASIRYVVPIESAKLDFSAPLWTFDRAFEKRLLSYFYLVRGNESKVATDLLPILEKEFSDILTPKGVRILSESLSSGNRSGVGAP